MTTATLTSLAILKVNVDHGGDYLDYLRPFVRHALAAHVGRNVTADMARTYVETEFGLVVPPRTVEIVLRRIAREERVTRSHGVYRVEKLLSTALFDENRAKAEAHIRSVIADLREYSARSGRAIGSEGEAVAAVTSFLASFDVSCLRAYLRGTALPDVVKSTNRDIVLVSSYVRHIQQSKPRHLESFMFLVRGHMLANALLCPDLDGVGPTYEGVTFYFDTPLLVQCLGLEGPEPKQAALDLVVVLKHLGGSLATLAHSREELENVVRGAAEYLTSSDGRGRIVLEARKRGTRRSDLLLLAEKMDRVISELGLTDEETPGFTRQYQIDEEKFGTLLDEFVRYNNPKARLRDIESVRSVYALRRGRVARSIERTRAVMVTNNTSFADAAAAYERRIEESANLSAVISDLSLANAAWLKAPMGALGLPRTRLLALAYGALCPSDDLWHKFMREIDRLESDGTISARDHQLLRSAPSVPEELMYRTAGDTALLTGKVALDVVDEVKKEMDEEWQRKVEEERESRLAMDEKWQRKAEEERKSRAAMDEEWRRKVEEERESRVVAEREREKEAQRSRRLMEKVYWRCHRRATRIAWLVEVLAGAAVAVGSRGLVPVSDWAANLGGVIGTLWMIGIAVWRWAVKGAWPWIHKRLLRWLLHRERQLMGVSVDDFDKSDEAFDEQGSPS